MEYYFQTNCAAKSSEWTDELHELQLMFGVKEFMTGHFFCGIPGDCTCYCSGVVLDVPEASKLLSSVAIALSNCGSIWPAFVPVHDPTREAFFGIQNMGTIFTRRFDADRIRSQVPIKLMHLEGLHQLFLSKFVRLIRDGFLNKFLKVKFLMRLTYITPPFDGEDDAQVREHEVSQSPGKKDIQTYIKTIWDDDYPWSNWYSAEDPLKGFELTAIWSEHTVDDSLEMEELENASVFEAEKWLLSPVLELNMTDDPMGHFIGFSSQLRLLVKALDASFEVKFIEDLITDGNPASVPSPSVLDRVLKGLFHDGQIPDRQHDHGIGGTIKGAPLGSLFAQFCLNALWFGNCNIHAIAVLWIEFVREVRWCWEESQPLPRTMTNGRIDLSSCLIHQKLQMLAICIGKKGVKRDVNGNSSVSDVDKDPPIMTEDMHEERLQAVEAFGDEFSFSALLEREILSSDMSAFKAANPDAVFEDFIRWHSPGIGKSVRMKGDWPPRGRLSARMSDHGNSWRKIWDESPSLPASEQKPLLDPIREGEKILHYLETLRPCMLVEQMISSAFKASLDTLSQTSYGDLKQMKLKIEQLYKTISTSLKPLRGNIVADRAELIGDLVRLCAVFEHVEKLLIFAASIRHKLADATRLCEAIFSDFYNYYLPKMGTGSSNICYDKVFKSKQLIKAHEREVIISLFPHPTANQSWRKVLSMGNLLNGHEPLTREIIFLAHDGATDDQYGRNVPRGSPGEVCTHRMYVCGTSNDLQVALSVTSWD
ncbi:unnamed protein product [Spirodela intermedia]|uniref:Rab3 GTPase-activating protein catalytic subunit n=1 Tax=Spirodela intermedia TaxID=51605 RepID=A0A7I8ICX9_SPIIN|nr:unnamed protein product [Spirodela intermedia]CAA6654711.1 unnamed protein product [Spirodela intermedia]